LTIKGSYAKLYLVKNRGENMKFISWNVNGFRACLDKGFKDFFYNEDADFFCIQETKMQIGQATFEPQGYYQYWNSAEKKG
jgi:exodeoxyribonuclease-3